jgi:hypothetical protein
MALYLDETWVRISSKDDLKNVYERINNLAVNGWPKDAGVTLKAGPWFSNEEAKVIFILDMDDPANDFGLFANALASGRTLRRRLTPIVDWNALGKVAAELK